MLNWRQLGWNFHTDPGNPATVGVARWPSSGDTAGYRLRSPKLTPVSLISMVVIHRGGRNGRGANGTHATVSRPCCHPPPRAQPWQPLTTRSTIEPKPRTSSTCWASKPHRLENLPRSQMYSVARPRRSYALPVSSVGEDNFDECVTRPESAVIGLQHERWTVFNNNNNNNNNVTWWSCPVRLLLFCSVRFNHILLVLRSNFLVIPFVYHATTLQLVLLHDTLPVDLPDLWASDILILAFLVFNPGDLYYLGYKK